MLTLATSFLKTAKVEIKKNLFTYFCLSLILLAGVFVRVYRTTALMGFYYDQGRDALIIWNLLHHGKFFLIGPVTGLAGIFLGPFYYYLIAPFYFIGQGDPAYPAVFLALVSLGGVFMLYVLGWKFQDRTTGIIAALIGGLSYYLVLSGRWLSNPTPIMLTSMILLWAMWEVSKSGKEIWWIVISLVIGLSVQFESASAFFYIPMIGVFAFWQRKNLPKRKNSIIALSVFLITLAPQLVFDFRHNHLLFRNFLNLFFEEKSFKVSFWRVFSKRMDWFWTVYYSKLLPDKPGLVLFFSIPAFYFLLGLKQRLEKHVSTLLIFIFVPVVGYFAFQGNSGNIYDYYMTGYYFPLVLLFSLGLGIIFKKGMLGKLFVAIFLFVFISTNLKLLDNYLTKDVFRENQIALGTELAAVNWVYADAGGRSFNMDYYVPPVIPYSYDYLFLWQGRLRCGQGSCGFEKDKLLPMLYTLYEVDRQHPWRLEEWQKRQAGIGEVQKEATFGGITAQLRKRL